MNTQISSPAVLTRMQQMSDLSLQRHRRRLAVLTLALMVDYHGPLSARLASGNVRIFVPYGLLLNKPGSRPCCACGLCCGTVMEVHMFYFIAQKIKGFR